MNSAIYDQTSVDIVTQDKKKRAVRFRATGSVIRFSGFTAVYLEGSEDEAASDDDRALKLPEIVEGDTVDLSKIDPSQHFTQPPPATRTPRSFVT